MKVWTYVITCDDGGAPNFEPPETTLTVCKPYIRKHAQPGELVIAFNGKRLNPREPHSVLWAGIVSEFIPLKDYWNDLRFQGKKPEAFGGQRQGGLPDNIYRPTQGGLEWVENKKHKRDRARTDISGENALVLKQSWYFGSKVAVLPTCFELRMDNRHRRDDQRPRKINEHSWRELKQWLDDNVPNASAVVGPSIDRDKGCGPQRRSRNTAIRRGCNG